jgi:hypothetical protein
MDHLTTIFGVGTGATFICLLLMDKKQRKAAGIYAMLTLILCAIGLAVTLLS